jgi:hypothetical protein
MLSVAGVQRSGTPAESKHPYPTASAWVGVLVSFGRDAAEVRPGLHEPKRRLARRETESYVRSETNFL